MPITGFAYVELGALSYEWNDLEAASIQIREAIERSEQGGNPRILAQSYTELARVELARGDAAGALEMIRTAAQLIYKYHLPLRYTGPVAAVQVRLWLAQGNVAAAAAWAQTSGVSVDDKPASVHEIEHLALVGVLIKQREFDQAMRFLERLRQAAESAGRVRSLIQILALWAVALQARSNSDQALATLERALSLAEPEGYIRTFVDAELIQTSGSDRRVATEGIGLIADPLQYLQARLLFSSLAVFL
jgi:LuxR family maltose regulon positive regulatory protein